MTGLSDSTKRLILEYAEVQKEDKHDGWEGWTKYAAYRRVPKQEPKSFGAEIRIGCKMSIDEVWKWCESSVISDSGICIVLLQTDAVCVIQCFSSLTETTERWRL